MSETDARPLRSHGDMASCCNDMCISAERCWRYMKPDHSPWQSFFSFRPSEGADRCDNYIPILQEVT